VKRFSGRPQAALLLIALLGLVGLRPALHSLATARANQAGLEAALGARPPKIAALLSDGEPPAGDRAAASGSLLPTLRALGARQGVLVEMLHPATDPAPGLVAVELRVSGTPAHVLQFAEAVESHGPLIRFARWRIGRIDRGLRLDALAVMPWEARR
jgi:hypothetical protein